jgi:hypothetical protein
MPHLSHVCVVDPGHAPPPPFFVSQTRFGMLLFAVGLQAGTCTLVLSAGGAAHSPLSSTIRVHVAVLDPSPSPTLVAITQACEACAADIESSACTALPCASHTHLVA